MIEPSVSRDQLTSRRVLTFTSQLPAAVLLNEDIPDTDAIAMPHQVNGLWLARMMPVKAVGSGLPIQFFYYNSKPETPHPRDEANAPAVRRLGSGLQSDPNISIPRIAFYGAVSAIRAKLNSAWSAIMSMVNRSEGEGDHLGSMTSDVGELLNGPPQVLQVM